MSWVTIFRRAISGTPKLPHLRLEPYAGIGFVQAAESN